MSEAYWAKTFFRDFLSHFIGMTKEEMAEDIAKSLKAVAKLDENGDCWGCEMVRSATERMNGKAAKAHKESGKLGGRPKKQTEPNNEVQFGKTEQPQHEQSELLPVQQKPKVEKKKFGEFENVLLTDGEVSKLQSRCNTLQINFNDVISRLSSYKAQKGVKYKSDYAAILNWVLNRCVEEKNKTDGRKSFQQIERERQAQFVGSLLDDDVKREYGIGGF